MIPQFPKFKNLELTDRERIDEFTHDYPPYSDFNFTSMWVWNISNGIQISILHDNLVVRFTDYLTGEYFYSFLGHNKPQETVDTLLEYAEKNNVKTELKFITQEGIEHTDHTDITPDHNNFDYIYDLQELSNCAGKKYETQRNLMHRFENRDKNHRIEFVNSVHNIKEQILELNNKWINNKNIKSENPHSKDETEAIKRLFDIPNNTHICATCVYKEDNLVAFFINEIIPESDYAIAHFVKADTSISGIYAYLINQNCKHLLSKNKKYLNYEQDMGLKNLRQSKQSLNPKIFLKKHIVKKI